MFFFSKCWYMPACLHGVRPRTSSSSPREPQIATYYEYICGTSAANGPLSVAETYVSGYGVAVECYWHRMTIMANVLTVMPGIILTIPKLPTFTRLIDRWWSRVSSGSIVSGYGLDDRAIWIRSPAVTKDFSSNLCVQTGSAAHPASCPVGTGGPFPGGKGRPGSDANNSPPSSTEVVNE
jgi:hypothetical protein